MPRWFTRWTPALRMARRDARRHKGRTALVLLMIMLPVLAGTVALTILRSSQPTDATYADLMLGEEAQARLTATCAGTVLQDVRGEQGACDMTEPREPAGRDEVVQQLPASSALVQELTATVGARAGDRSLPSVSVVEVDAREIPGRYTTTDGRLPEHAGEVALAPADSEALDVSVDDTVTLTTSEDNSVEATVTGVLAPQWGSPHTIAHPGTIPGLASQAGEASDSAWYVVGPEPVSWGHVLDLNDIGVTVVSRAVIADPPSDSDIPLNRITAPAAPDMQTIGIIAAVLGVGLLEIILLIGPAFTVGARRSTRQLAVLAASGGAPADLRRVVLASGVVLGLLAGVLGAATGLVLAWALIEVLRNYHIVLPGLVLPLAEITGLVALAVALGVAASWLPARRASQQDIVAALAGRRSEAAPRRGTPWVGLALVVAGLVAALTGGLSGQAMMLLAGALAMETGLILAAGGIIALAGRLAPRLGPAARIALRDAARQRGRTAPAVAAVIAAVAGMAGAAVFVVSDAAHTRLMYQPYLAQGTLELGLDHDDGTNDTRLTQLEQATEHLSREVPIKQTAPAYVAALPDGDGDYSLSIFAEAAPGTRCPLLDITGRGVTAEEEAEAAEDPRCQELRGPGAALRTRAWTSGSPGTVYVDDGSSVALYGLPGAQEAAAALREGKILVNDPDAIWDDGNARITVDMYNPRTGQGTGPVTAELPAEQVSWTNMNYDVILTPEAAADLDLSAWVVGMIAVPEEPADRGVVATANAAMEDAGADVQVAAEIPRGADSNLVLLVLLGAAALVGLGATWVSVGLAAAESRPDLATLAAVGAAPQTRRRVAGAQAGVIAGIGVPLGVLTGLTLGAAFVLFQANAWGDDPTWQIIVPWPVLTTMAILIPLLAILGAMAVTRSKLPLTRRVAQ